ncbi:hypothetical protein PNA2_1214 [Pyrococcus sp. NA2]|uniref:hypothetical protein n=1 Tax=Pyrococcus sp. (strain NA2) TaxID=342949 RepID=UPI000209AC4B|nr:hypothetical protein [Pyrococcus sp. NA2]AEC52128.1 hypothetical protein PNA2_1214 [Pyrococcus sp. NA2]
MIGDLLKVRKLLEEGEIERAIRVADEIEDAYWRSYALKWIAQELAKENPEKAREVAMSIPISSLRRDALLYVVYELAESGEFREAILTAKAIKDAYTKKKALRKISNEVAEVLKKSNVLEISLSELGIDEEDIPLLEPLPEGIRYEKGKLILTKDVSIVKGVEIESKDVVEVSGAKTGKRENVESLEVEEEISYENIPEPFRSSYIEDLALKKLEEGNVEEATKLLEEVKIAGTLPRLLFFIGKCNDLRKVVRPIDKLLLAYRAFLLYPYEEAFSIFATLFTDLLEKNPWKFIRLLKFLSFELLAEGKKMGNEKLVKVSRMLFSEAQRQSSSFSMNLFA